MATTKSPNTNCIILFCVDAGIVGLTPQERMKVRMHEKAKKKTSEKYSVQQLLEKVTLMRHPQKYP